ncbi:MAG: hypothetical protein AAGI07_10995 [Bacteroidota bacterium]
MRLFFGIFLFGKLFFVLLLGNTFSTHAQRLKWQRLRPVTLLDVGIIGNAYKGDLNSNYNKWSGGGKIGLLFNKKEKVNGSLQLSFQNISGQILNLIPNADNEEAIFPNTFFKSNLITAQYAIRYNLIKKEAFHFYLSQGIGLFHFNPKDVTNEALINQVSTRNFDETYTNISFYLPSEVGVIFLLRNGYGIGTQCKLMHPLTDYLDNIAELGSNKGNDNVLSFQMSFYVPLSYYTKNKSRRR